MSHELSLTLQSALLRALWAGHTSQRGRILKALARLDEATLSGEPAASTFRRLLGDERDALCRGVGELIAHKQLSAYTVDLVPLLRASAERQQWAGDWLRRLPLARAARAALVALAADPRESGPARQAALRVLRAPRQAFAASPASALEPAEREALLVAIAREELHADLLRALGADAGEVDEPLVEAAIAVNARLGAELYRERRGPPGVFERLFAPRPSSLGVWPQGQVAQGTHLLGIARLAAAARSRRWLAALHQYLHLPRFGPLLQRAYREEVVREVAAPLLGEPSNFRGEERAALTIEILGLLGERQAIPRLRPYLAPPTARPTRSSSAALLALARLGDAAAIDGQLRAVLARLEQHLRGGRGAPSELGDPAPNEAVEVGLRAATELEDARFAFPAFGLLAHKDPLPSAGPALPGLLARLHRSGKLGGEGLELLSRLKVTLAPPLDQAQPTRFAQQVALATVLQGELVDLVPAVAALALAPQGARAKRPEATLCDPAAEVLARLGGEEHGELLAEVLLGVELSEGIAFQLWRRVSELRRPEELGQVALRLLREGRSGRRAQEAALRHLAKELPPARFLRLCLDLIRSPHGAVRTRALREACERGLFRELPRLDDELPLPGSIPAQLPGQGAPQAPSGASPPVELSARPPAPDLVGDLLASAAEAFAEPEGPESRRQVRILLDALLPLAGRGPLDADEARLLRRRLRTISAWVEAPTFHAMHRELLEVAELPQDAPAGGEEPLDLGLCQALVLRGLAEGSFPHPHTGKAQRYWGPLPRFEETWASPSPFVQVALFELVSSPGYLRTDSLVVRFLGSPRAVVRRGALGLLSREACLSHPQPVLACLRDPDPEVRRACVARLREHELARHADALRPLLRDPSDPTRLLATRTLAEWGDPSCLEALTLFLASEDEALRREAVSTLRGFDPGLLGGVLTRHLREETPRAAAAALAALRPDRLPGDRALGDAIFKLAAQSSGPLRARALSFLPALAEPGRLGELVPLLRDEEPSVRAAAADVLRRRDGRRLAASIAAAAVAARDVTQRLEILSLLADLGAPEAAGELVPLLLAPDAPLRAATRRALRAGRAFSRAPRLAALLTQGLQEGADPAALAELIRFLDQTGPLSAEGQEPCAGATWAAALRCEELGVWNAALHAAWRREPSAAARAQSVVVDRLEAALQAAPAPSPAVLGRALREVERREVGERPAIRAAVRRLAEREDAPALRRKALSLLARWGDEGAGARAKGLLASARAAGEAQAKALAAALDERQRKQRHFRGRVGTPSERRALTRSKADAVAAARIALEQTRGRPAAEFVAQAAALPELLQRSRALNAWIVSESARRWLADAKFPAFKATQALSGPDPKRPAWQRPRLLSPPLRVLLSLRDRLAPGEWQERVAALPAQERAQLAAPLRLAALAAGPGIELEPWREALGRLKPSNEWRDRQEQERLSEFCLAAMEHWRPELRELFPDLVGAAVRWHAALPSDRWGGKTRHGKEAAEGLARAALRLNRAGPSAELVSLAGGHAPFLRRFHASCDDAAPLAASFAELAGTSKASERAEVCQALCEVGDALAAEALAGRVGDDAPAVRAWVARGAWQVQAVARAPLAALLPRLWEDDALVVRVEALLAGARLGLPEAEGWTRAALLREEPELAQAACLAAEALKLSELVGLLSEQLAAAQSKPAVAARRRALQALAEARHVDVLAARLVDARDSRAFQALAAVLRRLLEAHGSSDGIGAALGAQLDAPPERLPTVLGLVASARHEPAAAALESLLEHPEAKVRAAAARAAQTLGLGRGALDAALRARLDPSLEAEPKVREAAFRSLVQRDVQRGERAAAWATLGREDLSPELDRAVAEEVVSLGGSSSGDEGERDFAAWALGRLVRTLGPGFGPAPAGEAPLSFALRLGLAEGGLGRRARRLLEQTCPAPELERFVEEGAAGAGGLRVSSGQSSLARALCRVLALPGAEHERLYAELFLLRCWTEDFQVAWACLRDLGSPGPELLRDALDVAPGKLRAELALALSEHDAAGALAYLRPDYADPEARARVLVRAAASDPLGSAASAAGELRERVLAEEPKVRWIARVALDPGRRGCSPHEPWPARDARAEPPERARDARRT